VVALTVAQFIIGLTGRKDRTSKNKLSFCIEGPKLVTEEIILSLFGAIMFGEFCPEEGRWHQNGVFFRADDSFVSSFCIFSCFLGLFETSFVLLLSFLEFLYFVIIIHTAFIFVLAQVCLCAALLCFHCIALWGRPPTASSSSKHFEVITRCTRRRRWRWRILLDFLGIQNSLKESFEFLSRLFFIFQGKHHSSSQILSFFLFSKSPDSFHKQSLLKMVQLRKSMSLSVLQYFFAFHQVQINKSFFHAIAQEWFDNFIKEGFVVFVEEEV
jgi:hypothetical protein